MSAAEHRSTGRVLDILDLIVSHPEGLSLSQIAAKLNAPKSSLFPIVQTMATRKYLSQNRATSTYTIGSAAFRVGMSFVNTKTAIDIIGNEMVKLVSKCQETSFMAVLENGNAVYLLKKDSSRAVTMKASIGVSLPAYATSVGKALLLDSTMEDLRRYYPNGLAALTPNTITDMETLYNQLQQFRSDDICFESEESNLDVRCVSTPIRRNGAIECAISIAAPVYRCSDEKILEYRDMLLETKRSIEGILRDYHLSLNNS